MSDILAPSGDRILPEGRAYLLVHAPNEPISKGRARSVYDRLWRSMIGKVSEREIEEMLWRVKNYREFGTLKDATFCTNKILYSGLKVITGLLAQTAGISIPDQIQLGTSTQAVSVADTGCVSPITTGGLEEDTADSVTRTTTNQTSDTYQLDKVFTASASLTVNEMAIRNTDGTPLGYARLSVSPAKSVISTETLTVTYKSVYTTS